MEVHRPASPPCLTALPQHPATTFPNHLPYHHAAAEARWKCNETDAACIQGNQTCPSTAAAAQNILKVGAFLILMFIYKQEAAAAQNILKVGLQGGSVAGRWLLVRARL